MSDPRPLYVGNKAGTTTNENITKTIQQLTSTNYSHKSNLQNQKLQNIISAHKKILESHSPNALLTLNQQLRAKLPSLSQYSLWMALDLDMFYIACEIQRKPYLADLPCAVGGYSMISTSNYVARQYGVRSAMPGFIGKELCKELILIKPDMELYRKKSELFMDVLGEFGILESQGLDEVSMEISESFQSYEQKGGNLTDFVQMVRDKVHSALGLTCSAGVGVNRMLAKIASEAKKPDGQCILEKGKEAEFLKDLPTRKIPGVGNILEQELQGIGIYKIGDILEHLEKIFLCYSEHTYQFLVQSALGKDVMQGIGRNMYLEQEEQKSISVQRTYPTTDCHATIMKRYESLCENLSQNLIGTDKLCKHITVVQKNHLFDVKNYSHDLENYISSKEDIFLVVQKVMERIEGKEPLRLLGVRASKLIGKKQFENQSINTFFEKVKQRSFENKLKKIQTQLQNQNIQIPLDSKYTAQVPEVAENQEKDQFIQVKQQEEIQSKVKEIMKETDENQTFWCPICNKTLYGAGNNTRINKHIDQCLNQKVPLEESPNRDKSKTEHKKTADIREFQAQKQGKKIKESKIKNQPKLGKDQKQLTHFFKKQ